MNIKEKAKGLIVPGYAKGRKQERMTAVWNQFYPGTFTEFNNEDITDVSSAIRYCQKKLKLGVTHQRGGGVAENVVKQGATSAGLATAGSVVATVASGGAFPVVAAATVVGVAVVAKATQGLYRGPKYLSKYKNNTLHVKRKEAARVLVAAAAGLPSNPNTNADYKAARASITVLLATDATEQCDRAAVMPDLRGALQAKVYSSLKSW